MIKTDNSRLCAMLIAKRTLDKFFDNDPANQPPAWVYDRCEDCLLLDNYHYYWITEGIQRKWYKRWH